MPSPAPDAEPGGSRLPPVPAYAWAWLQRSRPVLAVLARRLTGSPPTAAFVEALPGRVERDPFTRDILLDIIAEVAFNGRVPSSRPPGASWDRGLSWWAATLAGTTPAAFDAPAAPPARQRSLFEADPGPAGQQPARGTSKAVLRERRVLADVLRALLRASEGDQVPASALRQLIAQLDPR
ncbi:MAG: hypothetical protein GEU81_18030 [Nitriliruptorales bacterium]|nr:hypothetical protein [Nitriliruptorales bacterium]